MTPHRATGLRAATALLLAIACVGFRDADRPPLACDGTTDDRPALQAYLDGPGAGRIVDLPDGCHLRLSGPTAGEAAITLPANTTLRCGGAGAAVELETRSCSAGRYAGAACTADDDCTFCGSACAGARCTGRAFAPDPNATYAVLRGTVPGVAIESCAVDVHQVDPFRRCAGGTNDGRPCGQICSDRDGVTLLPAGLRLACETDADCTLVAAGAKCLYRADCSGAGGTCSGPPGAASGGGNIQVVDFSATRGTVRSLRVIDHLRGEFAVSTGPGSEIVALDNTLVSQPTTLRAPAPVAAVATAAIVRGGTITDSNVQGTVSAIAVEGAVNHPGSRVERNTIAGGPPAGVGVLVNEAGVRVADNTARQCPSVCIQVVTGAASIVGNRLTLQEGGTGIDIEGLFNLVDGNMVSPAGANIAGTTGIAVGGLQNRVVNNHLHQIETGIRVVRKGFNVTVANNRLSSTNPDSMAALRILGAGVQLIGNYVNWSTANSRRCGTTCTNRGAPCSSDLGCESCSNPDYRCLLEPLLWLGFPDPESRSVVHPTIIGNLFAGTAGVTAVRVAHVGRRCTAGPDEGKRCTAAQACAEQSTCFGPGLMEDVVCEGNAFLNTGLTLDLGEINDEDTLVRNWVISGNLHPNSSVGASIRFPTAPAAATNLQVRANAFSAAEPFVGWQWRMGAVEGNGPLTAADDSVGIIYLTNRTGERGRPFDAVEIDPAHDNSFAYAAPGSRRAVGILLDEPDDAAVGKIAARGTTSCNVDEAAVQRGDLLEVSAAAGRLAATAATGRAILAVALSAKPAGAPATVRCLVQPGRVS